MIRVSDHVDVAAEQCFDGSTGRGRLERALERFGLKCDVLLNDPPEQLFLASESEIEAGGRNA